MMYCGTCPYATPLQSIWIRGNAHAFPLNKNKTDGRERKRLEEPGAMLAMVGILPPPQSERHADVRLHKKLAQQGGSRKAATGTIHSVILRVCLSATDSVVESSQQNGSGCQQAPAPQEQIFP